MIIAENVQITDRRSLKKVSQFVREQRNHQREKVTRGSQLFIEKWDGDRLSHMIGAQMIPEALSKSMQGLVAHFMLDQKGESSGSDEKSGWRELLVETLERLIPRVMQKVMS